MIADLFGHSFVLKWSKIHDLIEFYWVNRVCRHATRTVAEGCVVFVSKNFSLPQIWDNLSITQFDEKFYLQTRAQIEPCGELTDRDMQSNR